MLGEWLLSSFCLKPCSLSKELCQWMKHFQYVQCKSNICLILYLNLYNSENSVFLLRTHAYYIKYYYLKRMRVLAIEKIRQRNLSYYSENSVSLIILLAELTDAKNTSKYFSADGANWCVKLFNGSSADVIKYARQTIFKILLILYASSHTLISNALFKCECNSGKLFK